MSAVCSTSLLLNHINDLLDLAKSENNSLQFSNNFFNLEEVAKESLATLDFLAKQKEISTSFKISKIDSPQVRMVFGDKGRINQVLINLLSNALKFTDTKGKVDIEVNVLHSTPSSTNTILSDLSKED